MVWTWTFLIILRDTDSGASSIEYQMTSTNFIRHLYKTNHRQNYQWEWANAPIFWYAPISMRIAIHHQWRSSLAQSRNYFYPKQWKSLIAYPNSNMSNVKRVNCFDVFVNTNDCHVIWFHCFKHFRVTSW